MSSFMNITNLPVSLQALVPSQEVLDGMAGIGFRPELYAQGEGDGAVFMAQVLPVDYAQSTYSASIILQNLSAASLNEPTISVDSERIVRTVFTPFELTIGSSVTSHLDKYDRRCKVREVTTFGHYPIGVLYDQAVINAGQYLSAYYSHLSNRLPAPIDKILAATERLRKIFPFAAESTRWNSEVYCGYDPKRPEMLSLEKRLVRHFVNEYAAADLAKTPAGKKNAICLRDGNGDWSLVPNVEKIYGHLVKAKQIKIAKILSECGLSLSDLVASLDMLRSPVASCIPHCVGGGFSKTLDGKPIFKIEFDKMIERKLAEGDLSLKVLLGGTLIDEVLFVSNAIIGGLHKTFLNNVHTGEDFSAWLAKWNVGIVGYSIVLNSLSDIRDFIEKHPIRLLDENLFGPDVSVAISNYMRGRTRTEYIDLLDAGQWLHIANEKPDVVFTASSLYVSRLYSNMMEFMGDPEKEALDFIFDPQSKKNLAMSLWYSDFIMRMLPVGGIFVTEGNVSHVIPHPTNIFPVKLENGNYSGVFVKQG